MKLVDEIKTDVVVLGSGPGGYTAAFRAADLGKKVVLVERYQNIGGVCLNVGCIPSKGYIHTVNVLHDMRSFKDRGIDFTLSKIDSEKLCEWKDSIVQRLSKGLAGLAKKRDVRIIQGDGAFKSANSLEVIGEQGSCIVHFENAIIAAGSAPRRLPNMPDDERIMDSTRALELKEVTSKLLVVGAGPIGLEMITIYAGLGADITLACSNAQLLSQVDKDLVVPLQRRMRKDCKQILYETKIKSVEARQDGLYVLFEGKHESLEAEKFDRLLYAIGREPNGHLIGAEKIGINVNQAGFIQIDDQMRTSVSHIFAVGDIADRPMLAHKSFAQGRVAAEVIAGLDHHYRPVCIPAVCYTDPEIAWVGLTERAAEKQNIDYEVSVFPWLACGKAVSVGRTDGLTKLIIEKQTNRIIGAGITGLYAGELIVELALAIELNRTVGDVARTIHPHPSLSETVMMSAEVYERTVTDLFLSKG